MPILSTKSVFWKNEAKLETLQKLSPDIWVFNKFVLKSSKTLNQIFSVIEYWSKALECKIWLTNTKSFCWESEASLQILQKTLSLYWSFLQICFEVCLKAESNPLSDWLLVQSFNVLNFVVKYKINFLEKWDKAWNSSKTFSLYLSFL